MSIDRQGSKITSAPAPIPEESPPAIDKNMVRTAVRLCQLGWSLIPLRRDTKVPHVRWQEFQHRRPSANEVGRWLVVQFPGCNYAVITGAVSGLVAVEADDEAAVRLLHEKFPPTPLRQMSRKGQHWLYRHPGHHVGNRVRCSVRGTEYAIDVRGDGGYVVGPGSTHASGYIYTEIEPWTEEALSRTPVFDPVWVDPRSVPNKRRQAAAPVHLPGRQSADIAVPLDARLRKARYWFQTGWNEEPILGTKQGENASGRCFWIACKLVQGFALTPEEALPLLTEWGQRDDQRDEYGGWYPWSECELYHKLASADNQEDREDRPRGYMLGLVHPPVDKARLKDFFLPPGYDPQSSAPRCSFGVFQGGKTVERIPARVEAGRLDVHELAGQYLDEHIDNHPVYHAGAWWEYTGRCYREVSADYLDAKLRLWLSRNGVNPKAQAVNNLLAQVRAIVFVDPDTAMPCWLNHEADDPDPTQVIAFRNGLFDVSRYLAARDDTLIPHTPRWFSGVCLPYDYDPDADCPRWRECLREWLEDEDQVELLQAWFGYNLVTDNSLQKFMFFLGPTRSGKSSTLNVLTSVLGRQNVAAATFQSLSGDFGLAELIGKQAVTISEIHADRSSRNVVQTIKNLTGGDAIPVNRKGMAIVSQTLPVRITIAANQLPRLPDDSNALKARMLMLHYPDSFLGREDHGLAAELEKEVPGIANWALEGLRLLRQKGRFIQAAKGKESLDDFGNLSAPVEQFLADCCEEGPAAWEATEHLHDAWIAWCLGEGHGPGSRNWFGSKLKAARQAIRNDQRRTPGGKKVRYYAGVQLNADGLAVLEKRFGRQGVRQRNEARASRAVSGCLKLPKGNLADLAISVVQADPSVSG